MSLKASSSKKAIKPRERERFDEFFAELPPSPKPAKQMSLLDRVKRIEDGEFALFQDWRRCQQEKREKQKRKRNMTASSSSSSTDSTFVEDEIESSSSSDSTTTTKEEEEEVVQNIDMAEWRLLVSAVEDAAKTYDTTRPIILHVIDDVAFPEGQQKLAFRPSYQVIGLQLLEYLARRRGTPQHAALVRACQAPGLANSKALFRQLFDTEAPGEFTRLVTSYYDEPTVILDGQVDRTVRRTDLAVHLFHFECENRSSG